MIRPCTMIISHTLEAQQKEQLRQASQRVSAKRPARPYRAHTTKTDHLLHTRPKMVHLVLAEERDEALHEGNTAERVHVEDLAYVVHRHVLDGAVVPDTDDPQAQ